MKVRRLDANHDWMFGAGLSNYAEKSEAVMQCVKTILLSFANDWFLDLEHGIKWWDYYTKNPDTTEMERDLTRNISNVIGLKSIEKLELLLDTVTRKMTGVVVYTDVYGNTKTVEQIVRD